MLKMLSMLSTDESCRGPSYVLSFLEEEEEDEIMTIMMIVLLEEEILEEVEAVL